MILRRTLGEHTIANSHTSKHGNKTKYMSIRPAVLYGSDFETNPPKDGTVNVWLWSIVRASDLAYICGETIEEWYEEIMKLSGIVCFHNLKFDGQFILDFLIRNGIPFDAKHTIVDATTHIPYRIALKEDLYIQDTMRVHVGSLEKMAKSYGLSGKSEKADFSVFHEYGKATDLEIEYVIQDSRIVAQVLKADCEVNDGYIPLTGAGFAKRQYVNWLKESGLVVTNGMGKGKGSKPDELLEQLFPHKIENLETGMGWQDLCRMSYMGGLCLVKDGCEGVVNGKTYVYDVNSAYPFQMCKPMPIREGTPTDKIVDGKFGVYWVKCVFSHNNTCPIIHNVRAYPPHIPPIQDYDNQMFTLYGNSDYIKDFSGTLVLTSIEIEYLEEYADLYIEEVLMGYVFDTSDAVFKDYIQNIYTERQKIKKTEPVRAEFLKLMMNSLYGKFGSGVKYGCKFEIGEDNLYREVVDRDELDYPWAYTPVATAITGYERVYIATIISKNWDGFVYTDTDSIHLNRPHIDGTMWIDQKALGALKCESISDQSKYLRPKCYVHINEREYDNLGNETGCNPISVKCGGMPANIKATIKSMDELYIGAKFEGKLMPVKYVGGVYLQPTTYKLNNAYLM